MSYQSRPIIVTLIISVLVYTVFLIAYDLLHSYLEDKVFNNIDVTLEGKHPTRSNKQRRI